MDAVVCFLETSDFPILPNHPDVYSDGGGSPMWYRLADQQAPRAGLRQRPRGRAPLASGVIKSVHGYRASLVGEATITTTDQRICVRRFNVEGSALSIESFEWSSAPTVFRLVLVGDIPSLLDKAGLDLYPQLAESGDSPAPSAASDGTNFLSRLLHVPAPLLAAGTHSTCLGDDVFSGNSSGGLTASVRRTAYRTCPSVAETADDSAVVRELSFSEAPTSQHRDPWGHTQEEEVDEQPPVLAIFADLESAAVAVHPCAAASPPTEGSYTYSSYCVSSERLMDKYDGTSCTFNNKAYWFQLAFNDMVVRNAAYPHDLQGGWRQWSIGPLRSMERPVIINSMDEVAAFLCLSEAAFYAGVTILDRYLASVARPDSENTRPNNFRCLVIACPFIASKLLDFRSPPMTRVIESLGLAVDASVICGAELAILTSLQFKVHPLTVHDVMDFLQHMPIVVDGPPGMNCYEDSHSFIGFAMMLMLDCAVRSPVVLAFSAFEVAFVVYGIACAAAGVRCHPGLGEMLLQVQTALGEECRANGGERMVRCEEMLREAMGAFGIGVGHNTTPNLPRIMAGRYQAAMNVHVLERVSAHLVQTAPGQ